MCRRCYMDLKRLSTTAVTLTVRENELAPSGCCFALLLLFIFFIFLFHLIRSIRFYSCVRLLGYPIRNDECHNHSTAWCPTHLVVQLWLCVWVWSCCTRWGGWCFFFVFLHFIFGRDPIVIQFDSMFTTCDSENGEDFGYDWIVEWEGNRSGWLGLFFHCSLIRTMWLQMHSVVGIYWFKLMQKGYFRTIFGIKKRP